MVDVAHDGDDRRRAAAARPACVARVSASSASGSSSLAAMRLVAHFLDHDHRRFLVEHLVDGDHLAQLHQRLDDLGRLDRHLVRELGHGDRLRHRRSRGRSARPAPTGAGASPSPRPCAPWRAALRAAASRRHAPPVVSPRILSARRRAASSWNTWPGAFFVGFVALLARLRGRPVQRAFRLGDGGLRGRSGGRGFGGGLRVFGGLRFGGGAWRPLPRLRAPSSSCASRLRACFFCRSSCWRAMQLLRPCAPRPRARRSPRREHGAPTAQPAPARPALAAASHDRRGVDSTGAPGAGALLLAVDEHALLAHLDLDRARLAARVGLLDLGGLLARQRDRSCARRAAPCACAGSRAAASCPARSACRRPASWRDAGGGSCSSSAAGRHLQLGRRIGRRWSAPCVVSCLVACVAVVARRCRVGGASARLEPVRARLHDQRPWRARRPMPVISVSSSTARSASVVARRDAVASASLRDELGVHAFEVAAAPRRRPRRFSSRAIASVSSALRARRAQLVDGVLVEGLDLEHLGDRHVGDFLEAGEALGDQDVGDFLVDVELLHEQLAHARRSPRPASAADSSAVMMLMLPAGQLGGQAHVLAAAADRDREVLLVDHDVHRVLLLVDHDRLHVRPAPARRSRTAPGLRDHSTMSTRSPASSLVTALTREPRMPTQVPIGSMRWSLRHARRSWRAMPGSRAQP